MGLDHWFVLGRTVSASLVLVFLLGGCSVLITRTPPPSPSRPFGPGERWLPVAVWEVDGARFLCAGGGFVGRFLVHGSSLDPRTAWMTSPDGSRHELAWPVGYSARFVPGLEVLDETGRVIAHEGSIIDGGCETPERGVWSVGFESEHPP